MSSRVVRVKVDHVTKRFKIPHEQTRSLKQTVVNFRKRGFEEFKVLDDVSFEIYEGEFFGILGRNGSGKSTLLKLLAGIYEPTEGKITVNGNLTPFIELGVGFNAELTGRENVFLNGAILGLTQKEIEQKYNDIVAFAELERFMDQKLKNYSSGMLVRLAFSIAIQAHNAILLIDEVLAVGDERFQDKCIKVFAKIKKDPTKTVVFVSHDMGAVQRFCDRAAVVHDGKLEFVGNSAEAALRYKKLNFPETILNEGVPESELPVRAKLTDANGKRKNLFKHGESVVVRLDWEPNDRIQNVGVALFRDDGQYVFGTNTVVDKYKLSGNSLEYTFQANMGSGRYYVQVGFFGETDSDKVYFITEGPQFTVSSADAWGGLTHLIHEWKNV